MAILVRIFNISILETDLSVSMSTALTFSGP